MLRHCALGLFLVAGGVATFTALRSDRGIAQSPPRAPISDRLVNANVPEPTERLRQGTELPIARVVLFNSGVAYFQREGEIDGDARVDLQFPASDINDLIKSMVLEDTGGGKVQALRYDSQEPIDQTLRSFAIDLSANPSYGQILNQARGARVEVTSSQNAGNVPGQLTGVIVGMESRQTPGQPEVELLNLLCQEGMRAIPLSQVQRLRFLDPNLETEFRRALEVVATGHDSMKKAVRLGFKGQGKRKVRVGYVVENPIWKTSYRLVLDGKEPAKLQGWAAIENMGDEDWSNVQLTLVSGRPISFQMDLYPPLSIPRPVVEPELFASLRPPTYDGPMTGAANIGFGGIAMGNNDPIAEVFPRPPQTFIGQGGVNQGFGGGVMGFGGGFGGQFGLQGGQLGFQGGQQGMQGNRYANPNAFFNNSINVPKLTYNELQQRRTEQRTNREQVQQQAKQIGSALSAVDAQVLESATSDDLGLPSRYPIDEKVSLSRKQSALLPLLEHAVETERVSIFNEGVQAKHPLLGLKFKNTSKQALMQGPIAIYEDGQYAGDARVMDLQPGEERLISYAIDLGTEVKTTTSQSPGPKLLVRLEGSTLRVQYMLRSSKTYVIKNRSPHDRTVIVEQPVRGDWKLVEPAKPSERSRDVYRFAVAVKAGEETTFTVAEEQSRLDPFEITKDASFNGFATAIGLDVWTESKRAPEDVPQLLFLGDQLDVVHHHRNALTYFIRNRASVEREIILEHSVEKNRKVINGKEADELNGQRYRFVLKVAPNKVVSQQVIEEFKEPTSEVVKLQAVGAPPRPGTDDPPVSRFVTELGFEAWSEQKSLPSEIIEVKILKGEIETAIRLRDQFTQFVRNTSDAEKTVFVDHMVRTKWTLMNAAEAIPGQGQRYRTKLTIPVGKVATQPLIEQQTEKRIKPLLTLTADEAKEILENATISAEVKAIIRKTQEMKARLTKTEAALQESQTEVKRITDDQTRLRQNMEKLPTDTPVFKRYLMKLDERETELEKVQGDIERLTAEEKKQRQELMSYLADLNAK